MLQVAFNALVVLVAFAAMEGVAWTAHRYVMHGWGWGWHRDHHEPHGRALERNDLYAVVFALPAMALFWAGVQPGWGWATYVGIGVTLYGATYALVHDAFVHRRWGLRWAPKGGYAKRVLQAHRLHHATQGREGAVSFGFLYAPDVRRLKAALAAGRRNPAA